MNPSNFIALLGIPVSNLPLEEAVEKILQLTEQSDTTYVSTVNLDYLYHSHGQKSFKETLLRSALVTPDGMPLIWLSHLLGSPLKERVSGADLTPVLVREMAKKGKSIFLLGPSQEVANKAAALFKNKHKNLKISIACPQISEDEDAALVNQINFAKPSLLLISLGSPKQEIWFERNFEKLRVPVAIGIGGTLNFLTGTVKRAPLWMQSSGLEWLYRLWREPRRLWRRYLMDACHFVFSAIPLLIVHWLLWLWAFFSLNKEKTSKLQPTPQGLELVFPSMLTIENYPSFSKEFKAVLEQKNVCLNFKNTLFIDPYVMALFIKFLDHRTVQFKNMKRRIALLFKVHNFYSSKEG